MCARDDAWAKGEAEVWPSLRSSEALAFESERLRADRLGQPLETVAEIDTRDLPPAMPETGPAAEPGGGAAESFAGREREALVRLQVNQSFFRRRILSAYDFRCCVTGLAARDSAAARELLVANHLDPWSKDPANRLNPRNGLCLNALHDRAFDRGLMWIEDDYVIRFAAELTDGKSRPDAALTWLTSYAGRKLILPANFGPDEALLRMHAIRQSLA